MTEVDARTARPSGRASRKRSAGWDTVPRARRGQWALVAIAVLALPPGLVAAALRLVPPTDDGPALLASFIPYGILAWLVAALCLVVAALRGRGRRPALIVLSLLALTGLAYQVAVVAPLFVPDGRPAGAGRFTVLSLNMRHGYADPVRLTEAARDVDVVVLVEATPVAVQRLEERGWQRRFPYVSGATLEGSNGSVIFSRFPQSGSRALAASSFQQWETTVEVPVVGPVQVLAVHPCNPLCGGNAWTQEHAALREQALAERGAPLVLAGDFNAVDDHGPLQQLRRDGLRSATDVAGAGWLPTWPANRTVPPLIPIDHVLIDDRLTATALTRIEIPGTDHTALRAELAPVA